VIGLGMISSLTPATVMASNSRGGAEAQAVAQAGADAIEAYINDTNHAWATHQSNKTEGWWFTDATATAIITSSIA